MIQTRAFFVALKFASLPNVISRRVKLVEKWKVCKVGGEGDT